MSWENHISEFRDTMQTILYLLSFYRGNDQSQESRTKTLSKPLSIKKNFRCLKACSVFLKTELICPAIHYRESFLISGEVTPWWSTSNWCQGPSQTGTCFERVILFFFFFHWLVLSSHIYNKLLFINTK